MILLAQDWQNQFGHPVLLAEAFVDPQRFRGTCYRAANWQALGRTQGFARSGQDYYVDTQHPKELWVAPLGRGALRQLRAPVLAEALRKGGRPLPPPVPVPTARMSSLASFIRRHVRDPHGVRHSLGSVVATSDPGHRGRMSRAACDHGVRAKSQPRSAPPFGLPPDARRAPPVRRAL